MALDKQTKTILLHEGMDEHADKFLLESPALEYVENGIYDKDGVISKRKGATDISGALGTPDGTPSIAATIGDNLYTFSDDAFHRYDGSDWTTTQLADSVKFKRGTVQQSTEGRRGISCPKYVRFSSGNYVIAHTVYGYYDAGLPTLLPSIVYYFYDTDDNLLGTLERDQEEQPYLYDLQQGGDVLGVVFARGEELRTIHIDFDTRVVSNLSTIDSTIYDDNPFYGGTRPSQARLCWSGLEANRTGGFPRFVCSPSTRNRNTNILVAYRDTTGDIVVKTLSRGSLAVEGTDTITIASIGRDNAIPLACDAEDSGARGRVVYSAWDQDVSGDEPELPLIFIRGYQNKSLLTVVDYTVSYETRNREGTPASEPFVIPDHATIIPQTTDGNAEFLLIFHAGGSSQNTAPGGTYTPDGLFYALIDGTDGTRDTPSDDWAILYGHRLVSNGVCDDDDRYYACVQMFTDSTPLSPAGFGAAPPGGSEGQRGIAPMLTPGTTVLAEFIPSVFNETFVGGSVVRPVATLNAGVSRYEDIGCAGMRSNLATLVVGATTTGGQYRFKALNRTIEDSEDAWVSWNSTAPSVRAEMTMVSSGRVYLYDFEDGVEGLEGTGFGDGIQINSALPLWFDGEKVAEASPIDSPVLYCQALAYEEWDSADYAAANLKVSLVCGYKDSKGNIHRSAPSKTYFVPGFSGSFAFSIAVPLTLVNDASSFLEIYSTKDLAADPQLTLVRNYNFTGNTIQNIEFQTTRSVGLGLASVVRYTPFIYTTGGVLPSDPWPLLKQQVKTSDRLWAISQEYPGTVFYSKLFSEFVAPEFSGTLAINFGDERTITAIGTLDDKVVVFESNKIHIIYGKGPNNTARGSDFAVHPITSEIGTVEPKSVVECPIGLVFKGNRGIYLLTRDLQLQYIGSAVEDLVSQVSTVSYAEFLPDEGEVRIKVEGTAGLESGPAFAAPATTRPAPAPKFLNPIPTDGECLVWNYEKNSWSVFSNFFGDVSTIFQNKQVRIHSDWSVWQDSLTSWNDPTGTNQLILETPWIKFNNLQDFARLYRATFLGRYLSSGKLVNAKVEAGDIQVKVLYDYERNYDGLEYGDIYRWIARADGTGDLDDNTLAPDVLSFPIRPGRQKLSSVKFRIEEIPTDDANGITYTLGRGFEITAIDLELGLKGTSTRRVEPTKRLK